MSQREMRVELVTITFPMVLFPWVVASLPSVNNHSIETERNISEIVFTSQVIVN